MKYLKQVFSKKVLTEVNKEFLGKVICYDFHPIKLSLYLHWLKNKSKYVISGNISKDVIDE